MTNTMTATVVKGFIETSSSAHRRLRSPAPGWPGARRRRLRAASATHNCPRSSNEPRPRGAEGPATNRSVYLPNFDRERAAGVHLARKEREEPVAPTGSFPPEIRDVHAPVDRWAIRRHEPRVLGEGASDGGRVPRSERPREAGVEAIHGVTRELSSCHATISRAPPESRAGALQFSSSPDSRPRRASE